MLSLLKTMPRALFTLLVRYMLIPELALLEIKEIQSIVYLMVEECKISDFKIKITELEGETEISINNIKTNKTDTETKKKDRYRLYPYEHLGWLTAKLYFTYGKLDNIFILKLKFLDRLSMPDILRGALE